MTAEPAGPHATAEVELAIGSWKLQARLPVPEDPVPLRTLLPIIRDLADGMVGLAVKAVEERGRTISCAKGCGACCRQLVPISEVEARDVAALVANLPEPRRTDVRERFAAARRRLEACGMLARLESRQHWTTEEFQRIGTEYFALGIPCPFLEEESCSIHGDRPITCREYLVMSPAGHCERPTEDTIDMVPLPIKLWRELARFDDTGPGSAYLRWVPLVLAPEWAERHPDTAAPRPGPEWLGPVLDRIAAQARPPEHA